MKNLPTETMLSTINHYIVNNTNDTKYKSIWKSWVVLDDDNYKSVEQLYKKVLQRPSLTRHPFMSLITGELQTSIFGVVKTIITDTKHGIINLRWEYDKNGF